MYDYETSAIDFVIIWVDGSDPEWQKERRKHQDNENEQWNRNDVRFRDWETLRYWFRAVERFAPWVRKVHFVTCGHYPEWLNMEHPKLHFVKHSDFIPHEYLPTFSSHPIELNLHRIEGLAEQFVYFNDDMFLFSPVKPTDFFVNGMPRDCAVRRIMACTEITHIEVNNGILINRHFNFRQQLIKHIGKWVRLRYGIGGLAKLISLANRRDFTGTYEPHTANAYRKATLEEVWDKCGDELRRTCSHAFRNATDNSQWLFRNWQIVSGQFEPRSIRFTDLCWISDVKRWSKMLRRGNRGIVCLNDDDSVGDITAVKAEVLKAFEGVFPEKSSFEK